LSAQDHVAAGLVNQTDASGFCASDGEDGFERGLERLA